ncbi:MAG TPA: cytochrome P450 [Acidimicrobiales bacterium]|jgi:cytochrome P450|nr:cytochrome P450 [Acidimicrobiales bacterium]
MTGHQDCRVALSCPELESQIDNNNLKQSDSNLLFLDGQAHERLRDIISRVLPSWRSAAESSGQFIDRLIGRLPDECRLDIVGDFAEPIAEDAMRTIVGLPQGEGDLMAPLLTEMSAQFDPSCAGDVMMSSVRAGQQVLSHIRLAVRQKSYASGSVLDLLNQARLEGELSIREMLASSVMLAHASFQNSANLLSFAAVETMTNPQVYGIITSGTPSEQRSCIEELLRLGSPVSFLIRRANAALTIGATSIDSSDIVIPCIGQANRDPAAFKDPDHFDASRDRTAHLAFGAGPHACLGAAIARAETLAAVSALAGRYRTLTLESVTWGSNAIMHGPTSLRVRLAT